MGRVSTLLERDELVIRIASKLDEDPDTIPVVEGPTGAGKSWLAQSVGAVIEEGGGVTLIAEGDRLHSDRPLYPLGLALAPLAPIWRAIGRELTQVGTTAEQLVGSTGIVTSLISTMAKMGPGHRKARKLLMAPDEQEILFDLDRLSDGKPILLIADNLHWWDPRSLSLLAGLRQPRMREAFGFAERLRIVAVQASAGYQKVSHPEAHDAFLRRSRVQRVEIARPDREIFPSVLRSLGMDPARAEAEADAVMGLTGGHLALVDRYVRYVKDGSSDRLSSAIEDEQFMSRLLDDRLHALGNYGETLIAILQIAAVLGLTFRRSELLCAFNGPADECVHLLRTCRDEQLLNVTDTVGRFSHDVFRQHFLDVPASTSVAVHQAVAACLRGMRPGDYEMRAFHSEHGELQSEAGMLAALASLRRTREGLPPDGLRNDVGAILRASPYAEATTWIQQAQVALDRYEYPACFDALEHLPHGLPRPLAAEAAIIRGAALVATRNERDRTEAIGLLSEWQTYVDVEFDIGLRVLQQLLYALVLEVDKTEGHQLSGRITQLLNQRAEFDTDAADALYMLDRSSGALFQPDVSYRKVRRATEHFDARTRGGLVRNPTELYRCLVNLGSKEVTNGAYADAICTHERLEEFVLEYAPGSFPRLDFPRSTALLARFRIGEVTAEEAVELQEEIIHRNGSREDPFYPGNALAVYRVLASDVDGGIHDFDQLILSLAERELPAPSLDYLLRANRCAARWVAGVTGTAHEWDELLTVLQGVPYPIAKYMIERHNLLASVIAGRPGTMSGQEFDRAVLQPPRFGPFWDQLGRGFRMPEVEHWN